jgi:hypothetical protein
MRQVGQGVHHTDLQMLLFSLGDMYRPSPNIIKVIEFLKGLSVKENLEISEVWRISYRIAMF